MPWKSAVQYVTDGWWWWWVVVVVVVAPPPPPPPPLPFGGGSGGVMVHVLEPTSYHHVPKPTVTT
eukprot:gene27072-biopygen6500